MSSLPGHDADLVRAIGTRTLTLSVINSTIGAGIFVLPAIVGGSLGAGAPFAYLVCAAAMLVISLSFAVAGSRVASTGGIYAYVRTAFGPTVGYFAGVLQVLSAILAVGTVARGMVDTLVSPQRPSAFGLGVLVLTLVVATIVTLNVRGVEIGARTVAIVTLAKLLPLVAFVVLGLFAVDSLAIAPTWPGIEPLGRTALTLIFAFVGVEIALNPGAEIKSPARAVPLAILAALGIVTVFYLLIHLVAVSALGDSLAAEQTAPLAAAASRVLPPGWAGILLWGGSLSMLGYVGGDLLNSPRAVYALARDGYLPRALAVIHPRFKTPWLAIVIYAALVVVVTNSGTFAQLAIVSNVAILSLYLMGCIAAMALARRDVREAGGTPFTLAGAGTVAPVVASAFILWLLWHATWQEFAVQGVVLAAAAVGVPLRRRLS